jgi:fibronectin type 3 domain-containing protein
MLRRDRNISVWTKVGTGVAVAMVLLLSVQWFQVTNGKPSIFRLQASGKKHTVALTWKASSSHVAGYNVYRSKTPGGNYLRITPSPVPGLSYKDNTVENGVTYYYAVRAVDARGQESVDSNETSAVVP